MVSSPSLTFDTMRGHWWRQSLNSSEQTRIEGVMERTWGLIRCGRLWVLDTQERPYRWRCSPTAEEASTFCRCQWHGTTTHDSSRHGREPAWAWETSCVMNGVPSHLKELRSFWMNPRCLTLSFTLLELVLLSSNYDYGLTLLPSWNKNVFNLFWSYWSPQLKDFEVLGRFWIF